MKNSIALLAVVFAGIFAYKTTEMVSAFLGGFLGHMFRLPPLTLHEFIFPFLCLGGFFIMFRIWRRMR